MKIKFLCMLSALLLLSVSCAKKTEDSSNIQTDSLPDSSTVPEEMTIEPEETTTTMTTTTAVTTTAVTVTTAITETTATETTFPFRKTTPVTTKTTTAVPKTTTAIPETEPQTEFPSISLSGIWEYNDYAGNRLEFRKDGSMVFWQDYSSVIQITDGNLIMSGSTTPIETNGTVATAMEGDNLVLSMTAEAGSNMSTLQGKYSLNDCMVADTLGGAGKMIWIDGDSVYFGVYSSYSVNGNTLTIGTGAQAYNNTIESDGATLTMITEDGSEDTLVKIQ